MSLFGDDDEAQFQGDLKRAIRNRILGEIRAKQAAAAGGGSGASIINNLYGGSGGGGGGGVMDRLGGGAGGMPPSDEDPYNYFVDISKEDMPIDPETGRPKGWTKKVHRHRDEKKK